MRITQSFAVTSVFQLLSGLVKVLLLKQSCLLHVNALLTPAEEIVFYALAISGRLKVPLQTFVLVASTCLISFRP